MAWPPSGPTLMIRGTLLGDALDGDLTGDVDHVVLKAGFRRSTSARVGACSLG
jgi:hypothetical protein